MDKLIDILTEFAPLETLVSIIAGLMIVAGGLVVLGGYFLNFQILNEIGTAAGVIIIVLGLLYLFSSVVGELLEAVV